MSNYTPRHAAHQPVDLPTRASRWTRSHRSDGLHVAANRWDKPTRSGPMYGNAGILGILHRAGDVR